MSNQAFGEPSSHVVTWSEDKERGGVNIRIQLIHPEGLNRGIQLNVPDCVLFFMHPGSHFVQKDLTNHDFQDHVSTCEEDTQHSAAYKQGYKQGLVDGEGELDKALEELEAIGWPCRLVELPQEYDKLSRLYAAVCKSEQSRGRRITQLEKLIEEHGTGLCVLWHDQEI